MRCCDLLMAIPTMGGQLPFSLLLRFQTPCMKTLWDFRLPAFHLLQGPGLFPFLVIEDISQEIWCPYYQHMYGATPCSVWSQDKKSSVSTVAMFLLLPWSIYADATAIEADISVSPQKFLVALKCLVFNFDQCFWLWKKKERERKLTFSFFIFWVELMWQISLY